MENWFSYNYIMLVERKITNSAYFLWYLKVKPEVEMKKFFTHKNQIVKS